ncbi:hypothetical protein NUACC26_082570 [Scytonema sp. NUACC26]
MKLSKVLIGITSSLAILTGVGYWYVFILGAPQFDPPQEQAHTGLKFQLETFNSQAMGTVRQYGAILPPDYHKNPKSVIQ